MNSTIKLAINNFKYVFLAQLIVLIFGMVKTLFIPNLLSVPEFGYWQIYLFYSSYVGIFMLGFNDGIYLRYGKFEYNDLPKKKFRSSIRIFTLILLLFMVVAVAFFSFSTDSLKRFSLIFAAFNIFVLGLNGVFIYILQITNQMKHYSFFTIFDKIVFMLLLLVFTLTNQYKLEYLIIGDLVSKAVVVIGMMIFNKELVIGEGVDLSSGINEYTKNVSIGVKLMLAQFMGMMVTGIGRVIVEYFGNIEEYAYYSLGITITNLVLVLITSISTLIYPTLKRLPEENYPNYYEKINYILQKFIILIPLFFIITFVIIPFILPQYRPVLVYLNLLFGVIILQAKMQLLNNNFYNALRKETAMMKANIGTVILFAIIASSVFYFTKSIWSIALCTFIVMLWRCYLSEIYLRKIMKLSINKGILTEVILIIIFVVITSLFTIGVVLLIYAVFLLIVLLKNRKKLIKYINSKLLGRQMR